MRKRNLALTLVTTGALVLGAGVLTALPSGAATAGNSVVASTDSVPSDAIWSGSGQWDSYTANGYTLYNDVWGSGAGTQTVWAKSVPSNWGVYANHPRTSGIKSYANISYTLNKTLSSLSKLSSSYNVTVPSDGDYETTYDIWANNNAYEIMIWANKKGAVGPIAESYDSNGAVPTASNVNVGGSTWNIYRGSNGANAVYSFLRTSDSTSGTLDVLAMLNWLKTSGWWGDVTLGQFQFGYEISGTAGNADFVTNSYNLSFS
jgi:hypothetical protein